jgi:acyl transferase domain-containing protein
MYLSLSRAHFLSPTGQCRPFDATADGYCRAEGCGMFVLKRLSDAIAENDRILGVIKNTEINQSGNASSITHPHAETQQKLFDRLLTQSKIIPQTINVVEAHGTGTQVRHDLSMLIASVMIQPLNGALGFSLSKDF